MHGALQEVAIFPMLSCRGEKCSCSSGGLSPEINNFDQARVVAAEIFIFWLARKVVCPVQVKRITRPTDVPDTGLICDLLWADPDKEKGTQDMLE